MTLRRFDTLFLRLFLLLWGALVVSAPGGVVECAVQRFTDRSQRSGPAR